MALTVLLTCLFGIVSAMVLWVAGFASATREEMMRRGGQFARPEEY